MTNSSRPSSKVVAEPEPIELDWAATALLIIDMQRDFMEPGGFGETLGNDVSRLARAVKPIAAVLSAARDTGMLVIHTREGHLPDLSDAPPAKVERGAPSLRIGDPGPMGRILIRGEAGNDIIPELYTLDSEIVIDKPGKGAFYATELADVLRNTASKISSCAASPFDLQHHRARSQRPRLSLRGAGGWLRILLSGF
jgi:nicotinamidase-related amidase